MGHERLGYLPRSESWRAIVNEISAFTLNNNNVSIIAEKVLKRVRSRFEQFDKDPSIKSSFQFILDIAVAFKQPNPVEHLTKYQITNLSELTPLKIAQVLNETISKDTVSLEYNTISKQAAIDAIGEWYYSQLNQPRNLFGENLDSLEVLKKMSSTSGFCEVSRSYFAKFTERYLKYFLEREASSVLTNLQDRENFNQEINRHIDKISKHAFEKSKITQSFAAGWYNKHTRDKPPSEKQVKAFLSFAFGKLNSELLRESSN